MPLFGKLHGKDAPIRPAQVRQKEFALQGGGAAAQQLHRLGGLDGRAEGGREREGALFIIIPILNIASLLQSRLSWNSLCSPGWT